MKRATLGNKGVDMKVKISIHALVKRATSYLVVLMTSPFISIHALVKRATKITTFHEY